MRIPPPPPAVSPKNPLPPPPSRLHTQPAPSVAAYHPTSQLPSLPSLCTPAAAATPQATAHSDRHEIHSLVLPSGQSVLVWLLVPLAALGGWLLGHQSRCALSTACIVVMTPVQFRDPCRSVNPHQSYKRYKRGVAYHIFAACCLVLIVFC